MGEDRKHGRVVMSNAEAQAMASAPKPASAIEERWSKHCYGSKSALCFEAGLTKDQEPTVFLQGATAVGERTYDWKNTKITVQFSVAEMLGVLSVLLGVKAKFEGTAHGPENDKGFSLEHQGDKFFGKIQQKNKGMRAVPITFADATVVAALMIGQLRKVMPSMSDTGVMNLVMRMQPKAPVQGAVPVKA